MKKLEVIDINDYDYTLEDTNENNYILNIEFLDVKVEIGDYIYLDHKILKDNNFYTYGKIEANSNIEDFIKIIKGNEEIYLQRYYG